MKLMQFVMVMLFLFCVDSLVASVDPGHSDQGRKGFIARQKQNKKYLIATLRPSCKVDGVAAEPQKLSDDGIDNCGICFMPCCGDRCGLPYFYDKSLINSCIVNAMIYCFPCHKDSVYTMKASSHKK